MSKINEEQLDFTFDAPSWMSEVETFTTDSFLGQTDSVDDKRIVAFDFMNNKAYVISEETIENNQLNQKSAKEAFSGLVVLSQTAKETPGFGVEENSALLERAENAYRAQLFKSLNKEDMNEKAYEADNLVKKIKEEEESGITYYDEDMPDIQPSPSKEKTESQNKKRKKLGM